MITFISGFSLAVIFFCSTYMVLSEKVRDGVVLKTMLSGLALFSAIGVLIRIKGVQVEEVDMVVLTFVALTALAMLYRVVNGKSTFTKD